MSKAIIINSLTEVEISSSDREETRARAERLKEGRLRKIGVRLYTNNMEDNPEQIVRRNLFYILGQLYPGAVISHRSAFELKPTDGGDFFLTYKYTRNISLCGLTVHLLQGPEGTEKDMPFIENLYISGSERRLLENLQEGRSRNGVSKCLPRERVEASLEKMLSSGGENALKALRDKAKEVAEHLGMQKEYKELDAVIGALLNTRPSSALRSDSAKARVSGLPYDGDRVRLFEILFSALHQEYFPDMPEANTDTDSFRNFAFFESYFSNYIEGTEFELTEAKNIIDTGLPMPTRNDDSHDILGTFRIVASRKEMSRTPSSFDDLVSILQERHRIMMASRTDAQPGVFKTRNNRAGDTHFVDCDLVLGTFKKGFEYYRALSDPFAKAIFMLFTTSEIHPFNDGNGRISRIMMNAELVSGGQSKVIIPTVFRDDYLNALRRLTRQDDPSVLIRALNRVRLFSSKITGPDFDNTRIFLENSFAFKDEDGFILRF